MKTIKNYILLFAIVSLLFSCIEENSPVIETTGTVRGRIVTDSDSYEGIAIVTTIPWTKADTLNGDEFFELDDIPVGEYFIFVNIEGYTTAREEVEIAGKVAREVTFRVKKVEIVNKIPSNFQLQLPANRSSEIEAPVELVWNRSIDPDGGEVLYDVYFGKDPEPYNLVAGDLSDTTYIIDNLEERTNYFWKIVAKDEDEGIRASSISRFMTAGTIHYAYNPPEGKLPLPQHAPTFDENDYNEMMDKLWLASNCGDYLVGDSTVGNRMSLSLTFYTENETNIYSSDYGVVKGYFNGVNGISIVVEDLNDPSIGWYYQNLTDVVFRYGDLVAQGDLLGKTMFNGTYMYSVAKVRNLGFSWSSQVFGYSSPESSFYLPDDIAPQISDKIWFIRNGSNTDSEGDVYPTHPEDDEFYMLDDQVDIIVNIFDTSPLKDASYNYSPTFDYGQNVKTIDCWMTSWKTGEMTQILSIDFEKLLLTENDLYNLYGNHSFYSSGGGSTPSNFMVITNVKEYNGFYSCSTANSFNTRETDSEGNPLYPNGNYTLTITITDFSGNTNNLYARFRISNW